MQYLGSSIKSLSFSTEECLLADVKTSLPDMRPTPQENIRKAFVEIEPCNSLFKSAVSPMIDNQINHHIVLFTTTIPRLTCNLHPSDENLNSSNRVCVTSSRISRSAAADEARRNRRGTLPLPRSERALSRPAAAPSRSQIRPCSVRAPVPFSASFPARGDGSLIRTRGF